MSEPTHCQATSSDQELVRHTTNSNSDILDALDLAVALPTAAHPPSKQEVEDDLLPGINTVSPPGFATVDKEEPSSAEPVVTAGNPDSPLRVVVRCLSHKIPGHRSDRANTMANIICRHHLQRDMDREKDQIKSLGYTEVDGKKVRFLLECGTLPAGTKVEDVPLVAFKWKGKRLVPRNVDARTRAYLNKLPFKHKPVPEPRNKSKTMDQMREGMDDNAWNAYMGQIILRRLQWKKKASTLDRSWAKEHPDLFYDVMQQYTAQQRWHKLKLPPSQKQWVEAQKERGNPSTYAALIDVVLDNMATEG